MACERLAHWKNMGLTPVPLALSMPLSCLCREEMHDRMSACLLRHGIHPGWLELGIAEASQLPDEAGLAQLQRFVDLGLRLSVCDVGSAPIPLWQLQRLPVQAIGLRMLAQHDGHDQRSSAQLMSAVMSMARHLGLGFVVTGVDSEAKLEQLRGLAHIQVQGAALHPALLPEEIAHLLKHRQLLRAMSQAGEELQEPRA
jgi:EAL domain-containing protein (putative c-di-GMP-specific phosphodiesterase class I)